MIVYSVTYEIYKLKELWVQGVGTSALSEYRSTRYDMSDNVYLGLVGTTVHWLKLLVTKDK